MQGLIEKALANPWTALEYVLNGPPHPGGKESTEALLDRAGVDEGTRMLDVGCGSGFSADLARERGAETIGIDIDPPAGGLRGTLSALPIHEGSVDVVLAECVLCLTPEQARTLDEIRRVVHSDGRLALSDVVVEGEVPDIARPIVETLRLSNTSSRNQLIEHIEHAGFAVEDVQHHREDLLAMRDRLQATVDYEALLGSLGEDGDELLASIDTLETAVETGQIGYVSLIAIPHH